MTDTPTPIGESLAQRFDRLRAMQPALPPDDGPSSPTERRVVDDEGYAGWRLHTWHEVIPPRFHFASLDDFDGDNGVTLRRWANTPQRANLVLAGPVGTGKTHAACAACQPAHEQGLEVRFFPVVELLDMLRPGGPDGVLYDLADVDRLIIDDVGSEKPTDWTAERLYAIVNRRWLDERPTVITTNVAAADLAGMIGARTYSRIVGSGTTVVKFAGDDRRRTP